jgi:hypothetical protein
MRQRGWKVFLFFLTVILAVSFMVAPTVRADDDDDDNDREASAYEMQQFQGPGYYGYTYNQFTSPYDAMMGSYVQPMTMSFYSSNPMAAMMNPFGAHESYSQGSGTGSMYPGTSMQFGYNPMGNLFAQMYSPRYESYQSQSPLYGNTNYMMNFPGMGGVPFQFGPYSQNAGAGYYGQGAGYYGGQGGGGFYPGAFGGGGFFGSPFGAWGNPKRALPKKECSFIFLAGHHLVSHYASIILQ